MMACAPNQSLFSPSEAQSLQEFLSSIAGSDPLTQLVAPPPLPATPNHPPAQHPSRHVAGWQPPIASTSKTPYNLPPLYSSSVTSEYPSLTVVHNFALPEGWPGQGIDSPEQRAAKLSRMKQQADELSAWMGTRGLATAIPPVNGKSPESSPLLARRPSTHGAAAHLEISDGAGHQADKAFNVRRSDPIPSPQVPLQVKPQGPTSPSTKGKSKANGKGDSKKEKNGLLTLEQKRANHIASEQKRRAAIRQGYDRLCEVVPALNSQPEPLKNGSRDSTTESDEAEESGPIKSLCKKKRKKVEDASDAKAGSKSEAVVLARTVEYLNDLADERDDLLSRLSRAHSLARRSGLHVESGSRLWEDSWSAETMQD